MSDSGQLSPEHFGAFYRKLHPDWTAYRWHERAARELADGSAWKDGFIWRTLSAPTGTGKTTLIECFLFALACTEGRSLLPRRLFWVVDRRNVVDQVYEHAQRVTKLIADAKADSLTAAVRERLVKLAGDTAPDEPVQVRLWRGGLDSAVAAGLRAPLSPAAAAIVCSTVDQIGSRLLFRGYGVSPRSRPIEAALAGTDSLLVLDEAHLSAPFEETARAIRKLQPKAPAHRPPVQVVSVTATPRQDLHRTGTGSPNHVFTLTDDELDDPALANCIDAQRPVTLEPARSQVLACVSAAVECAATHRVIGVVANTVGAARRIATALRPHGEVVLIIGPARRLDREGLLERIPPRDARDGLEQPLFVVGTQTLEVGLDLDFDALVTECAPLPSLVQRFGRLDRAGVLTERKTQGRGVIVQPPKSDWIYGEAAVATWRFLSERAERVPPLGFSTRQVTEMLADPTVAELLADPASPAVDRPEAPLFEPWHIELLAQTSRTTALPGSSVPEPEVATFLRGERARADVQVCWRADLTGDPGQEATPEDWLRRVALRLPHSGELLSLPVGTARRWLSRRPEVGDVTDVESLGDAQDEIPDQAGERTLIRVPPPDGDGNVEPQAISPADVQPGDVIVLPASEGGCDEFGWDPRSHEPVSDLGNLSASRPRVLLSAAVGTPDELLDTVGETVKRVGREELSEQEAYEQLVGAAGGWLRELGSTDALPTPVQLAAAKVATSLPHTGRIAILRGEGGERAEVVLVPKHPRRQDVQGAVQYEAHAEAVADRVGSFATALGLNDFTPTLITAARHHDVGKLDRRFQAWLNGGFPGDPEGPLAKSERGPGTPLSWVARRDAGWPRGKRHEALSAALLAAVTSLPASVDRDLLLYLVSTHHGDARPFRSFTADHEPVLVTAQIDDTEVSVRSDSEIPWSEHAHRFLALNERFGPWGLAAIESLLVLADRSVSAEGS
ncbi:MAG: type I-G CRISPR-associated helicase/endonuclease Cas3g [Solirubrobacteraceae bacterium]